MAILVKGVMGKNSIKGQSMFGDKKVSVDLPVNSTKGAEKRIFGRSGQD